MHTTEEMHILYTRNSATAEKSYYAFRAICNGMADPLKAWPSHTCITILTSVVLCQNSTGISTGHPKNWGVLGPCLLRWMCDWPLKTHPFHMNYHTDFFRSTSTVCSTSKGVGISQVNLQNWAVKGILPLFVWGRCWLPKNMPLPMWATMSNFGRSVKGCRHTGR